MSSFETNPKDMKDLLVDVQAGKIQLPDFQRGWVWEDMRIRELLQGQEAPAAVHFLISSSCSRWRAP